MRTARPIVAFAAWVALGCGGKKQEAAPVVLVKDAAVVAPVIVDAAVAVIDPPPPPLTPKVGARGVQIIDLQYGGFEQPGLPAIRDDGSELVATAVADDGGRGYLNLRVLVIDGATGKVTRTIELADAEAFSAAEAADDAAGNLDAEEKLFATVRARAAEANAIVAAGSWRSLVSTERRDDAGPPGPSESLTAGDLTFSYDLARRRLTASRASKQVAAHDLARLVPKPAAGADRPCPGDLAYLRAVHIDEPTKKVLVELGAYSQGHNCGGSGPIYAVIALP